MDLVTIYIPTHNRPLLLDRALTSCFSQTYSDIEIIVSDDGSSSETRELISAKMKQDSRIKYIRSDKPLGACNARNLAIQAARGKYITGLDDDDEFVHHRVESLVSSYSKNLSFVCSNFIIKNNFSGSETAVYKKRKDIIFAPRDILFKNIASNQVLTETSKLRSIDGFNVRLRKFQDWDTWLRLSHAYGDFLRLKTPSYIMHDDSENRVSNNLKHKDALSMLFAENSSLYSAEDKKIMRFLINNRAIAEKIKTIAAESIKFKSWYLIKHYIGSLNKYYI